MANRNLKVIILAAGKGTRMKSELPKVLFQVAGKPMVDYVIDTAESLDPEEIVVIIGSGAELLRNHLKNRNVSFVVQAEQLGTGHAVMQAEECFSDFDGKILILCGDMPLVKKDTIEKFIAKSTDQKVSFISVKVKDPKGYGRVLRSANGSLISIKEEKDASETEKKLDEINTGIYLVDAKILKERLKDISNENAQKEYYLTDIVKKGAEIYLADDETEFIGINDRKALSEASKNIYKEINNSLMLNGVTIIDPSFTYIGGDVKIAKDVTIYPNTYISGKTVIGSDTIIYPGCRIIDSIIEEDCEIKDNSLIENSFVGARSSVGPMAHLRPESRLMGENKIGNFVETKKITFGIGSKASHLTYLGDAEIGSNVNVGCGTITCNYDGISKHKTVIGDDVFVGSDVQFVAPIKIGNGALIAAGSTITKDVPEDSLAITRADQKNIEGFVKKWKEKKLKSKNGEK
ncbi:MAG: bifunctional UDP-N-acetylglucosamine diphosphorylase/glucosamine-1-phosphate N-acetyltransferase GlmU [Calditerrivibrio sp.]|nr:bifunctional UDP-N-acetylglucosamine diphosphorylase/glucosamine-1-phosphate N-acetyltransferase GlmU [Calditerrivibrio sp.]MCA1980410.1 bifunctional UDP-N-acetylglucosamine diphosphorylase/glucosamine-1-phosphate N-acetyltransferase GlmU [Calditerrivibrio sp.]